MSSIFLNVFVFLLLFLGVFQFILGTLLINKPQKTYKMLNPVFSQLFLIWWWGKKPISKNVLKIRGVKLMIGGVGAILVGFITLFLINANYIV